MIDDDATAAPDDPVRVHLPLPIDVRSTSLAVLAVLAGVYALHWASAVFIPLMLGVMFSYALSPAVDRLQRWRLPRAAGAAALMVLLLGGFGSIGWSLADDAAALVENLPDAAQKLRNAVRPVRGTPEGAIEKVQRAAANLEQAAEERAAAAAPAAKGVTRVQIERPRFNIKDYLWSSTLSLVGFLGQATVVAFVTYFMLAAGDGFRRKLVKIAGPTLSKKKVTVQLLDDITRQIQRYLLVQVFTSVVVGVATWLALSAIGLERAVVWGVVAAVLDLVPYLGALVVTAGVALMGLLQFGTLEMAALCGGACLAIHTVSGNLLMPWLTSRASRMSPLVIFVGVLAWGWLWGIWGLLLGAPMLMIAKAVCDRVDDLKPIGELLGE